MAVLTIFTPTYNREKLLHRLYESLLEQTVKDFVWIIVDDGSTDNTSSLIEGWRNRENGFDIIYIFKENGGLHTGYNTAIEHANTELSVCIDSDDYMPNDAVEKIISTWNEKGSSEFAGIIGLDYTTEGKCLGDRLPEVDSLDLVKLAIGGYKIKNADRKLVLRTDLYKKFSPMPSYFGEKNFNPHYMHLQIGMEKGFIVLNECLCVVEYQPTGMSNNMFRQYYNSPNSFADIRMLDLSLPNTSLKYKIKKSIHYCSSCILAKRKRFIRQSPHPFLALITIIPGWLFSRIIVFRNREILR